jgi:hypothetical protein
MINPRGIATTVVLLALPGPAGCGGKIDAERREDGGGARLDSSDGSVPGTFDSSGESPSNDSGSGTDVSTFDGSEVGTPVAGSWLDTGLDASEVAPCLDAGTLMYVVGQDYGTVNGAINGVVTVGLGQENWTTKVLSGSLIQINVGAIALSWQLTISNLANGIKTGTYSTPTQPGPSYLQIEVDGGGCSSFPTGSYTIAEFVAPYGDEVQLGKLLVWFDLECADAGTLQGCVAYGN